MPNGRSPQQIMFSIGLIVGLCVGIAGVVVMIFSMIVGG